MLSSVREVMVSPLEHLDVMRATITIKPGKAIFHGGRFLLVGIYTILPPITKFVCIGSIALGFKTRDPNGAPRSSQSFRGAEESKQVRHSWRRNGAQMFSAKFSFCDL